MGKKNDLLDDIQWATEKGKSSFMEKTLLAIRKFARANEAIPELTPSEASTFVPSDDNFQFFLQYIVFNFASTFVALYNSMLWNTRLKID